VKVPFLELADATAELRAPLEAAFARVLAGGTFLFGPEREALEREFAAYCGVRHCVGLASGFDALALGLRALGVGPGDEVIVPSHTCVATWLAASEVGADVVAVEPDPETWNIDPGRVEAAVGPRTRALVAVHLYGQCAEMDALGELARRHGLALLEDAAQAAGARWNGRRAGALGDAAAFSFFPTKNLGALADAGALLSDDADLAARVRRLGHYGAGSKNDHVEKGRNSRLGELQAAFLRAKLPHLDAWNERRRALAQIYLERLAGRDDLVLPRVAPGGEPVWHLFAVRVPRRDALRERLAARGIGTAVHYPVPPHRSGAYAPERTRLGALPLAEALAETLLSLPLHPHLHEREVHAVCDALLEELDA
jgi:dTDP-3-amino-3,4,6-trideoxy-alpha-D-glucose transaminase